MIVLVLLTFVDLFVFIFNILLIARILMSYFVNPANSLFAGLVNLTEPVLAPVRRLLPPLGGLDLAPLATFFLLQGLASVLHSAFGA